MLKRITPRRIVTMDTKLGVDIMLDEMLDEPGYSGNGEGVIIGSHNNVSVRIV